MQSAERARGTFRIKNLVKNKFTRSPWVKHFLPHSSNKIPTLQPLTHMLFFMRLPQMFLNQVSVNLELSPHICEKLLKHKCQGQTRLDEEWRYPLCYYNQLACGAQYIKYATMHGVTDCHRLKGLLIFFLGAKRLNPKFCMMLCKISAYCTSWCVSCFMPDMNYL